MLFSYLEQLIQTQDGKILFVLTLIAIAMAIDFITGSWSARFSKDLTPNSNAGINGILRKVASLTLMLFFIPLSVLIPYGAGTLLLYTLYIGYLLNEILSILENFEKMGIKTDLFESFLTVIRGKLETKEDETDN